MELTVKKQGGVWHLNGKRQVSFADLVRNLERMGKGQDQDRYVVGLHFTADSGDDDYQINAVYAENPNRALYLAQMEAAEAYGAQYETQHGGVYDSVKWGEDEDHTHWLDTIHFVAAFISCEKTGLHQVVTHDLDTVDFWGCENDEHL